ncbi:MAG: JAB domain-containing protein, partial [bacterium]|nr:JAB domain-containing protein [bacterium]
RGHKKEHFVALYLNARNELIHREDISIGTVNASIVHPRDVFAPALEHNATAVIVAHNHPSDNSEPSSEDLDVTARLKDAGKLLGITLVEHIIMTKDSHTTARK